MREVIPIMPVVEVRETFTPSERLRDAIVDFLDPSLDNQVKESLRATFLFRSWRRRVMDKERYFRERNGTLHEAPLQFGALPHDNILLNGATGFDSKAGRIIVRSRPSKVVLEAYNILNSIPTVEEERVDIGESTVFYMDIAQKSLASPNEIELAKYALHTMTIHPATKNSYYLTPDQIVVRDTMARIRPPRVEDEAE